MSGTWNRLNYDNCHKYNLVNENNIPMNYNLSTDPYELNLNSNVKGVSNLWSNSNILNKISIENELFALNKISSKCLDDKHMRCDLDYKQSMSCPNIECCTEIPVVPALNERNIVKTNMTRYD
tara:strand:+ start:713 stop:1081 length:369 start_codon:yes stop_codon:yes gene_type:complete